MSALRDRQTDAPPATAENPHVGSVGCYGVELSKVAYWREDGDHVFRSMEYDVIAADEDFYKAVHAFVRNSIDYARFLSEAEDRTGTDVEIANMIMGRIVGIWEAVQRERERPILRRLRHGRRRRGNRWHLHPAAQS